MSRSYKKNPVCTDGSPHTTKESKKFANKKVRRHEDIPNGSAYKKVSDSYDIHDYIFSRTWKEAKEDLSEQCTNGIVFFLDITDASFLSG